ncbi:MAG: hypothetical protein MJA32_00085, partial [Proteobacteria bacterium]|nr:hypothetical protein [Pseudomonadota bacterium]
VNGKIRVDDGAAIEKAKTVNGSIRIGDDVRARNLSTVNGAVSVGGTSSVDGGIETVNGRITLERGAAVGEDVENVNGRIELHGAEIGGDLSTVTGDVVLNDGSVLKGDLVVEKPNSWGWKSRKNRRKPRIVIGPGSRVHGTIELEREVELFISESAQVGGVSGVMSIDDAVRFSGDSP